MPVSKRIIFLVHGCLNAMLWACRASLPSGFDLAPYFLSPATGQPISKAWILIWFFLPVSSSNSTRE